MKKEILITIGAICGTSSVVAAGVFLPSLFLTSSPSTIQINSNTSLFAKNTKASISVKEALLGTKKINNGNYVLYFGSEGFDSNFKFLYDVPNGADIEELKTKKMSDANKELSGDYWSAINYVLNNAHSNENIGTKPEFIAYVQTLGPWTLQSREIIATEVTNCLTDVLSFKDNYSNLSAEDKDVVVKKFNFVKTNIKENAIVKRYLNYSEITSFYASLKLPFSNFVDNADNLPDDLKNKTLYEAVNWKIEPAIIEFRTSPFATYTTWDSQVKYYDSSSYAQEFRDLWSFIKNYPLYSRVKDIDTTVGVIVGYKNGQLVDFYEGSFNPEDAGDNGDTGEDTGSEGTDSTTPQSLTFSELREAQADKDVIPEPTSNSFYTWLKASYPVENNN